MKVHSCMQGTSEWLELRAGIPTASQFDLILTKSGKPSQSAERYLYTLLAERLMGHPIDEHVSLWMHRGSQLEKEAITFYELQRDSETEPVGFITNDKGTIGASPDRLVGEDGLLEVKCPKEYIHVAYMLQSGGAYGEYRVQVQGQMWITGRQWVDVLSYHPELPWALHRIERDDEFIEKLGSAVIAFSSVLENQWEDLLQRGWGPKPRDEREKPLTEIVRDELTKLNADHCQIR
jgi:putative phage-type endonuclease